MEKKRRLKTIISRRKKQVRMVVFTQHPNKLSGDFQRLSYNFKVKVVYIFGRI